MTIDATSTGPAAPTTSRTPPDTASASASPREPRWFRLTALAAVVVSAIGMIVSGALPYETWERWVHDELGVVELLTVGYLLPAAAMFAYLGLRGRSLPRFARICFGGLVLATIYFAGEEASWGQHVLGFTPPEWVAQGNLQGEFNLHNADAWYHDLFNEVPRTIATACCLIGAGVLPWLVAERRRQPGAPRQDWFWLIPTTTLVLPGVLAFAWNMPEKFLDEVHGGTRDFLDLALIEAADEAKEYWIALTILLYAGSAWLRYRRWIPGRAEAAGA